MPNLQLNMKHLRYFWSAASHGSSARAVEALYLTPQTISGQLRELELQVGSKLFRRDGRNLVLTKTGRLVKAFGERGTGVFTSPSAVEKDVLDKYGFALIGRTEDITERFYAISVERRIKHPAVSVITQAARSELFA